MSYGAPIHTQCRPKMRLQSWAQGSKNQGRTQLQFEAIFVHNSPQVHKVGTQCREMCEPPFTRQVARLKAQERQILSEGLPTAGSLSLEVDDHIAAKDSVPNFLR